MKWNTISCNCCWGGYKSISPFNPASPVSVRLDKNHVPTRRRERIDICFSNSGPNLSRICVASEHARSPPLGLPWPVHKWHNPTLPSPALIPLAPAPSHPRRRRPVSTPSRRHCSSHQHLRQTTAPSVHATTIAGDVSIHLLGRCSSRPPFNQLQPGHHRLHRLRLGRSGDHPRESSTSRTNPTRCSAICPRYESSPMADSSDEYFYNKLHVVYIIVR